MRESERINSYANAMFRFERLHEAWLRACSRYLSYVFGDGGIRGRVVVDYGFGRGNWAVAFARCGAERVLAIDAAADNCRKLRAYCAENQIRNVEVVCGNVIEHDLDMRCDIMWLYGILPVVESVDVFLEKCLARMGTNGQILTYTYNAGSLREWIVSAARTCIVFGNEDEFRAKSLCFTPAARARAQDDLVAPQINWDSPETLVSRFARLGWHPVAQLQDFAPWLHGVHSGEFNPYVVKFLRQISDLDVAPQVDNAQDLAILRAFSDLVLRKLPTASRDSFAVGLFDTHFQPGAGCVTTGARYETSARVAWEDFKYLMYAATLLSIDGKDFSPVMAEVWNAATRSLAGTPREAAIELLSGSTILESLSNTAMRL